MAQKDKVMKRIIKKSPYDERCTEEIANIVLEELNEEKNNDTR